jgi:hypothetical protein
MAASAEKQTSTAALTTISCWPTAVIQGAKTPTLKPTLRTDRPQTT